MNRFQNSTKGVSRGVLLMGLVSLAMANAVAGGTVVGALGSADTEVRSAIPALSRIMLAVMAIMAIVGAISVYGKWSNGDPDTRKSAASWFGALIFAGLVLLVVRAVFGVS